VQRSDDDADVVRSRLEVYTRDTQPVVEYYRRRPTFQVVNGHQATTRVAADLDAAIDAARGLSVVERARPVAQERPS
jgi:adenylate kinase